MKCGQTQCLILIHKNMEYVRDEGVHQPWSGRWARTRCRVWLVVARNNDLWNDFRVSHLHTSTWYLCITVIFRVFILCTHLNVSFLTHVILFLSSSQPANFHRLSCFRFQCSSPKDTRTSSSSKASRTSTAAQRTSFRSFYKSTRHSGWAPRARTSKHTRSSRELIGGLWKHFSSNRRFCQASGSAFTLCSIATIIFSFSPLPLSCLCFAVQLAIGHEILWWGIRILGARPKGIPKLQPKYQQKPVQRILIPCNSENTETVWRISSLEKWYRFTKSALVHHFLILLCAVHFFNEPLRTAQSVFES